MGRQHRHSADLLKKKKMEKIREKKKGREINKSARLQPSALRFNQNASGWGGAPTDSAFKTTSCVTPPPPPSPHLY